MSALWTPGCLRDRICGVGVANSGASPPGSASLSPAWPLWRPRGSLEVMVRRRSWPESCSEAVQSTRVGIYWSGVVRTARRPHLRGVHTTILQWFPTLVQYRSGAIRAAASSSAGPGQRSGVARLSPQRGAENAGGRRRDGMLDDAHRRVKGGGARLSRTGCPEWADSVAASARRRAAMASSMPVGGVVPASTASMKALSSMR